MAHRKRRTSRKLRRNTSAFIGEQIKEVIESIKDEMYSLQEKIEDIEEAWKTWDTKELVRLRVISASQAEEIERQR